MHAGPRGVHGESPGGLVIRVVVRGPRRGAPAGPRPLDVGHNK